MSEFIFRGKRVHYQILGEGRPLLLLNGIMMSTKSWAPFLNAFQQGGNRLILVDLLDQGESEAMDGPFELPTVLMPRGGFPHCFYSVRKSFPSKRGRSSSFQEREVRERREPGSIF